jgi:8-oxo-dGTP pyrophosphatase MutT (NUDIX family)
VRLKALVWILRPGSSGPEVLLLERPARRGGGEHPVTGKAHAGEKPAACARREALEETGIEGDLVELGHAHHYEGRKNTFEEHSFLLRAPNGATPTLSDEHISFRWVSAEEAAKVLHWKAHREALDLALQAWGG